MTREEALLLDYEHSCRFVDKMDGNLDRLRNLAILSGSAVIAYAVSKHVAGILVANIVVCTAFFALELVQKSFHEDGIGA